MMKKRTLITLLVGVCLLVAGGILAGIGWMLDPTGWQGMNVSYAGVIGVELDSEQSPTGMYKVAEPVERVQVDWLAGEIQIQQHDGDDIVFTEISQQELTEETCLRWGVEAGTLYIQYWEPERMVSGHPAKDLVLLIPQTLELGELCLDTAAAHVQLEGLQANRLTVDTASGDITVTDCTSASASLHTASGQIATCADLGTLEIDGVSGHVAVENTGLAGDLDVETTSGRITLSGLFETVTANSTSGAIYTGGVFTARSVAADTASGAVYLAGDLREVEVNGLSGKVRVESGTVLTSFQVDSTSGSVELLIPRENGFTLEFDTASGRMHTFLPLETQGSRYVYGDGAGDLQVSTTSGGLTVEVQ